MPARRRGGVALLAAALAIGLTYPLAFKLDRVGRVDSNDGQFSIWNVAWVAHALTTDPRTLYQANIFYPHRDTLAYSESNILPGVLGVPAYLATKDPYATHNSVVLMAFALSFLSAYGLARYLTGSTGAAILCGIAYAYCPFVDARLPHIQLLMTFGLPLALLALHRLVDRPTAGRGVALALALIAQALACAYYGIFIALTTGLGVLYYAWCRGLWKSGRYWGVVGLAAAASIAVVLPFFIPYHRVQSEFGFIRLLDEARLYSADWPSWLASPAHAHLWMLPLIGHWNDVLFPGALTTTLGLAGMWLGLRGGPEQANQRETTIFYALLGVIAFWVSFGPQAGLYSALYHTIPIFSFLRAPARVGILVTLALAVLMAIAVRELLARRLERTRTLTYALLAAAFVAELAAAPLWFPKTAVPDPADRLLATLPHGPLVELPFFYEPNDYRRHTEYMLQSTYHWQPLINGYSDYIPNDFRDMARSLSTFPSMEAFRLLRERHTRYVVFHWNLYDYRSHAKTIDRLDAYREFLTPISRTETVWLYVISAWPPGTEIGPR